MKKNIFIIALLFTPIMLLAQQDPDVSFDTIGIKLFAQYLPAYFWLLALFVCFGMEVVKEFFTETQELLDPRKPVPATVCVKVCVLKEIQIKLILLFTVIAGTVLIRIAKELPLTNPKSFFDIVFMIILVTLIYFSGGKWLAEKAVQWILRKTKGDKEYYTVWEYKQLGEIKPTT